MKPGITDADRWRFLLETDPGLVAAIAYRFRSATRFGDPTAAVDAAIKEKRQTARPEVCSQCGRTRDHHPMRHKFAP